MKRKWRPRLYYNDQILKMWDAKVVRRDEQEGGKT